MTNNLGWSSRKAWPKITNKKEGKINWEWIVKFVGFEIVKSLRFL